MDDAKEFFEAWNRKCRTVWYWSQLYLLYKTAQARGCLLSKEQRTKFWEEKHLLLAEMVWSNITTLRGCWVKVGQFLSTRSDVLPEQYITYLARLQDAMPISPFSIIRPIIESEIGCPLSSIFSSFEENAFASASIAQVHRACLLDGNHAVAVKVQHPDVERTLRQDMLTLTQISWALGLVEKGLSVSQILEEWQKSAVDELDFRMEMKNQQRAYCAAKRSNIGIKIPKCYEHLTTKRIMVMSFSDGFKITDLHRLKQLNINQHHLVRKICSFFAYQIHVDGMFNGDPHPGNILIEIDEEKQEAIPVILDWGLVKRFSKAQRIAFSKAVWCIANIDILGFNAAIEDMGFEFKKHVVIDPEVYIEAFRSALSHGLGGRRSDTPIQKESSSSVLKSESISSLEKKNPIDDWPKDIIFLMRVASLLHGLCVQLEAKVSFLDIFAERAQQCLLQRSKMCSPCMLYRYPPSKQGRVRSWLEWKIYRLLVHLARRERTLLGCQVAVFKDNVQIVDLCIGQFGPMDTTPIERSTLFPLLAACHGLITTAVLQLVCLKDNESTCSVSNRKDEVCRLKLSDPVCHWWDGFIRFGKESITVYDVLTHRAGLHAALPHNLKLSDLVNYENIISSLEDAAPQKPFGESGGRYAYLTSSWILSELVRSVTGQRIDHYIANEFIHRLGLTHECFFPLPKASLNKATNKSYTENCVGKTCQHEYESSKTVKTKESVFFSHGNALGGFRRVVQHSMFLNQKNCVNKPCSSTESHYDIFNSSTDSAESSNLMDQSNQLNRKRSAFQCSHRHLRMSKSYVQSLPDRCAHIARPIKFNNIFIKTLKHEMESFQKKAVENESEPTQTKYCVSLPSKYFTKLHVESVEASMIDDVKRQSPLQLIANKPYVLDPIVYNSIAVQTKLIPGSNCRITARALAYFYSSLATGAFLPPALLNYASEILTVDDSLDTLILTGGGSRLFGLGYQLFPCIKSFESSSLFEATMNKDISMPRFYKKKFQPKSCYSPPEKQTSHPLSHHTSVFDIISNKNLHIVRGLGHGDIGGSIGLCFPELRLSIAILVNQFFTSPVASKRILRLILSCFNLTPCWDIPYTLKSFARDTQNVATYPKQSGMVTALQNELRCHTKKIPVVTSFSKS